MPSTTIAPPSSRDEAGLMKLTREGLTCGGFLAGLAGDLAGDSLALDFLAGGVF